MEHPDPEPAMRVLCVDDDADTADTIGVLLELAGFEARVCYDGKSALAALDAFRPDACILDLGLPGMDGYEIARHLREWAGGRPVPLVAVTGRCGDEARRLTAAAGFDLHLTKPVDPDKLATLLADIVILRGERGDSHLSLPRPDLP